MAELLSTQNTRSGGWAFSPGKRAIDLVVAATGLVLTSPVLVFAAALVKLTSRGPALFRQARMGRNFEPFTILKLRTMVVDAPSRGGALTRGTSDARITRLGRYLRATKIDELPQLINVVRGDMSLVGPRPEVPDYVEKFRNDYTDILAIRPGITDPASIKYRHESSLLERASDPEREYAQTILPDKLRLGRQYVRRASLLLDIWLLWLTAIGAGPTSIASWDNDAPTSTTVDEAPG